MHIARCRVLRPWITLGLLSVAVIGFAGEPKESRSSRDGVFAAWASPSVADTHVFFKSREGATALARHCRARLPVHLLPQGTPFTCRVEFLPPAEAGHEGGGLRLWVKGPGSKPDHWVYGLFTVSSPRHARWTERAATAAEQSALKALLATDTKLSRTVTGRAVGSARAVSSAEGGRALVVVPGKRVVDAFSEARRHHVFLVDGESARHLGELPDRPKQYVDVDGDDLPEVITDTECDGICVQLWTFSPRLELLVELGGH